MNGQFNEDTFSLNLELNWECDVCQREGSGDSDSSRLI